MKRLLPFFVTLVFLGAGLAAQERQVRTTLFGVGQPPPPSSTSEDAFFDDTKLQDVRLDVSARDWETLKANFRLNEYYTADLRWNGQVVRGVGIRSRGSGSRSGVKPGLRVDIDHFNSGQRFLGLKSFLLRNNTQDASQMRERLTMLLFRRIGGLASREAHARLFIRDDYVGLYTIVESIDKDFLRRNVNENDGYLYEYDNPGGSEPYFFDDLGSDPARYVPQPFQPETHEDDPRPEFIVQFVQTMNQSSDAVFRDAMVEFVDLRKFVRHIAVEKFVTDYDSIAGDFGMNNFYTYRFQDKKLFTFIAFDKSQAFSDPAHSIWRNILEGPAHSNKLMLRAMQYRDLYDLYLDTLLECIASFDDPGATGTRWIDREIEREYAQIRDAAYADPVKDITNEQFDGEVNKLRDFAAQRGPFVRAQVEESRNQGPPR